RDSSPPRLRTGRPGGARVWGARGIFSGRRDLPEPRRRLRDALGSRQEQDGSRDGEALRAGAGGPAAPLQALERRAAARPMRGVEQIPWLYDALAALAERGEVGRWRRWLTAGAHGRTLDVGTGTGRNLPLFPAGTFVVAVDPSLAALRRGRRRAPAVAVIAASAEALPFRDGVFDTIVSSLAFCSVTNPVRGLAEVRRVLHPSGHLRMLEHVRSVAPWRAR